MFPILMSPQHVALIFQTCQLHTVWELLHENGGSERPAAWHGQLHWQGRQHQGKHQSRGLINTGILYPRQDVQALLSEVSKVAKSLSVQLSEATVKPPQGLLFHCALCAASHQPCPSCLSGCFSPKLPPCSLLPAAGRPLVGQPGAPVIPWELVTVRNLDQGPLQ